MVYPVGTKVVFYSESNRGANDKYFGTIVGVSPSGRNLVFWIKWLTKTPIPTPSFNYGVHFHDSYPDEYFRVVEFKQSIPDGGDWE